MPASDYTFIFDWVFLPPARDAYDRLSPVEQDALDLIIDGICRDPWEDSELKTHLELDDGSTVSLFHGEGWQIVYERMEPRVLAILALSRDWWGAG